ncbi:murein biosynthesis integral membrane protein MurJ [Nocardioides nematodiphilus]|uniref:murein biosynthesis integral membrane protein MurJ n=1 Tax=Nocardioides nematodiphilus TaxID=2849669 RepID=UPI001CDA539D|nr:murein biosynthesis integral membrane protein MurJ [Nocardioides nematodiphilus]MCA1984367.1 murein biosynthesis integral membrane protein MurJ [Nocardioides nematodiphilus]
MSGKRVARRERRSYGGLGSASAVMAVGTLFSRLSGFVRAALLAAAIGSVGRADVFNVANTIPNMLYILLAGGVFNAVLVPQLVRAIKQDDDGGEAYTQRIVTLATVFLGAVTVILVAAAPLLIHLYFHGHTDSETASAIAFARYCLPQVFFYGMFVLVGQVLNARGSFGPMMWAPIANNIVSVAVLVTFILQFGASGVGDYTRAEEQLLGLGSTAGIALQFLILLPFLRAAGFHFRPRFDFRNSGLGHTFSLGIWTVLFVIVNQAAYLVITALATGGTGEHASGKHGTGYTIYSNSFLLTQVPHSIITVSLATAILPTLSARVVALDPRGFAYAVMRTLRSSIAIVLPFAALLPVLSADLGHVLFGFGASADQFHKYGPTIAIFGPGLFFFTLQYVLLRGFYALERNKTVFWMQCLVAGVNVLAAVLLVGHVSPAHTAPALAAAWGLAYFVGSINAYTRLDRRIGPLRTDLLIRFLIRMLLVTAVATTTAWILGRGFDHVWPDRTWLLAAIKSAVVGGVDLGLIFVGARLLRITELTGFIRTLAARLGRS